ncbi:TPA: neutral zinc metallopeptidase [Pasteurella multocida]|uniref:KPN_02809 family neutral zinc metallopeptidase n=1 Tax=Pasteurella multocida TaxID=747 RepID=UPI0007EE0FC5|nr:neutral zinc metallopeptidase [Pasteurella multocida]MBM2608488.1 neutral zinc metallopeptidase [Pasteurella multocida]MCL7787953.1 neutral zinc metallopeptidase [Pasteurella multocida]MCL7797673.1 neutral zinc metallopeptidase [Pasteurella multocida]MCL7800897.1 neutral zinc metallopeptidase [Pasteurella multocida]MDG2540571.1 neutral zinc metallopeptidase [Pasteurella multocida]
MRWRGRRESTNVEDRRASSGGLGGGKKTGILGIIILLIGAYYGVDLSSLVGTPDFGMQQSSLLASEEEQELNSLSRVVLADTETVWGNYFARQQQRYQAPVMVLYNRVTHTACGTGQSAMGPFYCPNDRKVYLDLSFYQDMKTKLGADGEAAFAYVIAHEVGHHIQNLLGILPKVHQLQGQTSRTQANQLSVKVELQADCFAGVWAYQASKTGLFETGDIEKAFNAAEAVGDDRLQKRSQGYVVPDSFTHGTSAQRLHWFKRGLNSGDPNQCNTF